MAKRLNDGACRTAGCDQMLGRGMAKIDHALTQHDTPGWTISQIGALGGHLRGKAKCVRSACASYLNMRSGFPRESMRHIVRCR